MCFNMPRMIEIALCKTIEEFSCRQLRNIIDDDQIKKAIIDASLRRDKEVVAVLGTVSKSNDERFLTH